MERRALRRSRRVRQHSAPLRRLGGRTKDRHREQLTPPVAPLAVPVPMPPDTNRTSPGDRPVLGLPAGRRRRLPHPRRRVRRQPEARRPLARQVPRVRRPPRRPREDLPPRRRRPEEAGGRGIRLRRRWTGFPAAAILNARDDDGNTALHLAVVAGVLRVFWCLFRNRRVCLDLANNDGLTPADLARSTIPAGLYSNRTVHHFYLTRACTKIVSDMVF
ncbi:Os11g0199000 [Oryza sativa Japonica Group]|uniref:Expressed protein n=2 Tax=Oryza sativa subsp. japonica TaxID=39947 RepID=Q2R9C2_ORYSJ|nr:expressed protein [Oryza sativa Japonica Group]BAG89034.1 unnamed protein product [Oryza sativa Japonica Group]BAH95131.1 Os11g0199000 [Oryza sativa Japonica Group]|eukprot:NP_001176403.1 Os11g0199000 [Oryza sativa Japonica Group]